MEFDLPPFGRVPSGHPTGIVERIFVRIRYGTWAGRIESQRYAPLWDGEGEEGRWSDCWAEFGLLMSSLMWLM